MWEKCNIDVTKFLDKSEKDQAEFELAVHLSADHSQSTWQVCIDVSRRARVCCACELLFVYTCILCGVCALARAHTHARARTHTHTCMRDLLFSLRSHPPARARANHCNLL